MLFSSAIWLATASMVAAQSIKPSNDTTDIADPRSSPRFWINSTEVKARDKFTGFLVAPLAQYAQISRNMFLSITFQGILVNTNTSNAAQVQSDDFSFVSCDPEDYQGGEADVNSILTTIISAQSSNTRDKSSLIFYSTRSNHCNASNIAGLDLINGIFTTLDPVVAAQVAALNFTEQDRVIALVTPDRSSYSPYGGSNNGPGGPTTAIAMIILYSITGIITAMFIVIIIVGAIRAHRHPERYGPRNMAGRPRQSRAKGIARAMLETLPIVKFGDHHDLATGAKSTDAEMGTVKPVDATSSKDTADKSIATTTTTPVKPLTTSPENSETIKEASNADGTDDTGSLGCSICTEDFQKGEEVRVLPCNHKFHPECVDPWLLNVSGTCPLCRINLATGETEEAQQEGEQVPAPLDSNPQPSDRRSQAIHSLRAIAYGSREERVAALRRYRAERRNRTINDEERLSRARRFREAFRIRTRRHETNATEQELRNTGIDAIAAPQTRM